MARFLFKRVVSALLTLFVVATLTFFLMHLIPGGPFQNERVNKKTELLMQEKYGLNEPLGKQYLIYMKDLLKGDLGISFKRQGFTVNEIIGEKFPVSAKLGGVALLLAVGIGIPMGAVAALKRNTIIDRLIMFFSTIGIAVPGFVMSTILLYFFGVYLKWFPTVGLDSAKSYVLPAIALSFYPMCYIARLMRSSVLDVIGQDYIKTARAKGLPEYIVLFKHALRNSILPVLTYLGPLAAAILTGGFVVERMFGIPGLGQYFISSITGRDYPMIMGTTIFLGALIIFANLIVDILYCVVDPRIKLD